MVETATTPSLPLPDTVRDVVEQRLRTPPRRRRRAPVPGGGDRGQLRPRPPRLPHRTEADGDARPVRGPGPDGAGPGGRCRPVRVRPRRGAHHPGRAPERQPTGPGPPPRSPRPSRPSAAPTTTTSPTTGSRPGSRTRPTNTSSGPPSGTSRPWRSSRPPIATALGRLPRRRPDGRRPRSGPRLARPGPVALRALGQPRVPATAIEEAGRLAGASPRRRPRGGRRASPAPGRATSSSRRGRSSTGSSSSVRTPSNCSPPRTPAGPGCWPSLAAHLTFDPDRDRRIRMLAEADAPWPGASAIPS